MKQKEDILKSESVELLFLCFIIITSTLYRSFLEQLFKVSPLASWQSLARFNTIVATFLTGLSPYDAANYFTQSIMSD